MNEVTLANDWKVVSSWKFKKESHINLLELKAVERLVELQARSGPSRFVNLVDLNVTRSALGKGRSASKALSSVMRRIASTMVAFGLYMVNPFCPTRLNCADDPTRLRHLRSPVPGWSWREKSGRELWDIALIRPTRRWASNWVRLVLFLIGPGAAKLSDRALYRVELPQYGLFDDPLQVVHPCPAFVYAPMEFDSTLGFPGEGHCLSVTSYAGMLFHLLSSSWLFFLAQASASLDFLCPFLLDLLRLLRCLRWCCAWLLLSAAAPTCAAMKPGTAAEAARAAERGALDTNLETRPTLPVTNRYRERCWNVFESWLTSEEIDFDILLAHHVEYIDDIDAVLARFGRALFYAGKPYSMFAETINTLTTKKPALRRLMQGAWDVAFFWLHAEPGSHHVAMPWQVLLSMITVSLFWGWTAFAGCLALGWGALLRSGEILASTRADLLLPRDVGFTVSFGLLSIQQPKTRRTGAKHQSTKLDVPDLLEVVDFCLGHLPPGDKLWPFSGQRDVLLALRLPIQKFGDMKPLDPGSLRSGGATWHLQMTEDGEYTRRKGRWLSAKIMEIYIQETAALMYLKKIPAATCEFVLSIAHLFPVVFPKVRHYARLGLAPHAWYVLLQREDLECMGRNGEWTTGGERTTL